MRSYGAKVGVSILPLFFTGVLWFVGFVSEEAMTQVMPQWLSSLVTTYPFMMLVIGLLVAIILYLLLSNKELNDQISGMRIPVPDLDFGSAIDFTKKKRRWRKLDDHAIQRDIEQAALLGAISGFGCPCKDLFEGPHAEKLEKIPPEFFRNCEGGPLAIGDITLDEFGFTLTNFHSFYEGDKQYTNVMLNEEQVREWRSKSKPLNSQ